MCLVIYYKERNQRSILNSSLHYFYITIYYNDILIAVSNIVYIILKVGIIVSVEYILFLKLFDKFYQLLLICVIQLIN